VRESGRDSQPAQIASNSASKPSADARVNASYVVDACSPRTARRTRFRISGTL
jgi:hypothetical protein